MTTKVKRNW